MPYRLLLDGQPLPLTPDTVIRPTLAGANLAKWGSYPSAYSNELSIPYAPDVAARLGFASHPQSAGTVPYDAPGVAAATFNGVDLLPGALLAVSGYSKGNITANLFQGGLQLFEAVGDKTLRQLSSLGAVMWTVERFLAVGYFPAAGQNWVATLEDRDRPINAYDPDNPDATVLASLVYPAVFLKSIFEAILSEAGWTYDGWSSAEFDRMVVPFSEVHPRHTQTWRADNAIVNVLPGATPADITVVSGGDVGGYLDITLDDPGSFTKPDATLTVQMRRTTLIPPYYVVEAETEKNVTRPGRYRIELPDQYIEDPTGHYLHFDIIYNIALVGFTAGTYTVHETGLTYGETAVYGTEWDLAMNLPDLKQLDVLKTVLTLAGLLPTFDPVDKVVHLIDLPTAIAQTPQDWSAKVAAPQRPQQPDEVAWTLGDYAQVNTLTWKEDETNGPDAVGLGNGELTCPNLNLHPTASFLELPFAASPDGVAGGGRTIRIPTWVKQEDDSYVSREVQARLAVLRDGTDFDDIPLFLLDPLDTGAGGYLTPFHALDCIENGGPLDLATRVAIYLAPLQKILDSVFVAIHPVRLTAADLATIVWGKPIAIWGQLWYLNELTEADPEGLTQATLIRLN